ncbi:MAG: hypothetical protein DI543_07695 [Bradyrhizobium icense]|nr:MAG: hypothetical protein DI543_07695 [Bradyrhizobium icense]
MTLFHNHSSHPFAAHGPRSRSNFALARVRRRIVNALKVMHRAIVAAKLRRLRNELMLHRGAAGHRELDAARLPQCPMVLGDKWDF